MHVKSRKTWKSRQIRLIEEMKDVDLLLIIKAQG